MRQNFLTGFYIIAIVSLLITACDKSDNLETETYPFARVRTESTKVIPEGGRFYGKIEDLGEFPATQHGFTWSIFKDPAITKDERIFLGPVNSTGEFSADITTSLYEGSVYYVRAFVINGNYVNYGDLIKFESWGCTGPEPDSLSPSAVSAGDKVVIHGRNFSFIPLRNSVLMNDIIVMPKASSDTTVTFYVPDTAAPGDYKVSIKVADVKKTVPGTLTVTTN